MKKRQIAAMKTRLNVIKAAEKLIAEKGFENVTIDDIAKEAGVAKGTFYTYFKRKEDVVIEIAKTNYREIEEKTNAIDGDVVDRIASFLTGSMKYIVESGLKICQQWIKTVVDSQDEDGKKKLIYDQSVIKDLLSQAIKNNELIDEIPIDSFVQWIVSEYYGIVFTWGILNGTSDPVKILEGYCQGQLRDALKHYQK